MAFSPENPKIWVDSREYSHPIQTATYPPFTKRRELLGSETLSNQWRHERLCMLEKTTTGMLRDYTGLIIDTKGHHGSFEDCDDSKEEAVLLVGQCRKMKLSVCNLDKLPTTCRRTALRPVRQGLIPYWSKPVVFKPSVGQARCRALFNLRDMVGQRVKLHYTQQPQGRVPPSFIFLFVWMPPLFGRQVPHVGTCTST